jgi:hypothetical protein
MELKHPFDEEYSWLWTDEIDHHALIRRPESTFGYDIMNTVHNTFMLVEDDDQARYVIGKMLEHGVRIVDHADEVKNLNPPDPIFLSPEAEAQYKKIQAEMDRKHGNKT